MLWFCSSVIGNGSRCTKIKVLLLETPGKNPGPFQLLGVICVPRPMASIYFHKVNNTGAAFLSLVFVLVSLVFWSPLFAVILSMSNLTRHERREDICLPTYCLHFSCLLIVWTSLYNNLYSYLSWHKMFLSTVMNGILFPHRDHL